MSFLKELGSLVGAVTGGVVGGAVNIVGEVTGSQFIEEIGDGIKNASSFAGDKLGEVASGTWDVAAGIITQDEYQLNEGINDLGQATGDTVKAIGHSVCNVVENGSNVVGGLMDGDTDRLQEGAKGLIKFGAVGALSFGMVDLVNGIDAEAPTDTTAVADSSADATLVENPNEHHVEPHWRVLPSGEQIWVDGDGDTSVNTTEGWTQSNPDYHVKG